MTLNSRICEYVRLCARDVTFDMEKKRTCIQYYTLTSISYFTRHTELAVKSVGGTDGTIIPIEYSTSLPLEQPPGENSDRRIFSAFRCELN